MKKRRNKTTGHLYKMINDRVDQVRQELLDCVSKVEDEISEYKGLLDSAEGTIKVREDTIARLEKDASNVIGRARRLRAGMIFIDAPVVKAMLGGKWPKDPAGFNFDSISWFRVFHGGVLMPYIDDKDPIGPDLVIKVEVRSPESMLKPK